MPVPPARRLDDLAGERAGFLDALEALSPAQRTARPGPDAWSPMEVAEHVFLVEHAMIRGLEKQLAAGDARTDVGPRSGPRVAALLFAMRSPKRITVPDAARGITPGAYAYDALRRDWADVATRWAAAVAAFPAALAGVPLLRHPIGGPLTLDDALRFLVAHARRHRRQLDRARPAAPPPAAP